MGDQTLHSFDTGADSASIVVGTYGNAKGTREQFKNSKPDLLDPIHSELTSASKFAGSTIAGQLETIITDLQDAWQGSNADDAVASLKSLHQDSMSISRTTSTLADSLKTFQTSWNQIKTKAEALGDDDTDQAHSLFKQFCEAQDHARAAWPNTLYYHDPLAYNGYQPGSPGGPGPGGPGGPGGPANGPGHPGGYPSGTGGGHPSKFPGPGPSTGPGPSVNPGPGNGPGGYPGGYPGGSGGPGGYPGGVDTNGHLAGITGGGPGGALGGGPGGPAGGIGGSPAGGIGGSPGALAGGPGAGTGAGPGLTGGGPGGGVVAGTPGRGMMGPGHGGGDEDERDRSTWLTEDDDLWNGDDAPPSVIR